MNTELKVDIMQQGLSDYLLVPYYFKDIEEDLIEMKNFFKRTDFFWTIYCSIIGIRKKQYTLELMLTPSDEIDSLMKEFIEIYNGTPDTPTPVLNKPKSNIVFYLFETYYDQFGKFGNVVNVYPCMTPYLCCPRVKHEPFESILIFHTNHDSYNLFNLGKDASSLSENAVLGEQIKRMREMLKRNTLGDLEDHFNEIVKSLPN